VGIGEAPATFAITQEDIPIILSSIEKIKESLLGLEITEALRVLHETNIGSSAKAALDIACVTLLAKQKKQSLLEYFAIKDLRPIQTDITISLNDKETMLSDAKKALSESMNILKIKLAKDINHAIDVTQALAKEFPKAQLLIDANQAWTKEESLTYIKAVEHLSIELIEQPVIASDLEGLKAITNSTKIPILADEACFTLEDVKKIVESQSADMINIKLMKCGGVSKAIEILNYAREKDVKCMLGSMLEGPYSINSALYLAFAYRDVIKYIDLDSPLLYKEAPTELDFSFDGAKISFFPLAFHP
jgi:L-alanine-DL-glutamate epimerase-like enolase superfamily enzyme